jgi:hypothetical protein
MAGQAAGQVVVAVVVVLPITVLLLVQAVQAVTASH